jgi:hypothetical protein
LLTHIPLIDPGNGAVAAPFFFDFDLRARA